MKRLNAFVFMICAMLIAVSVSIAQDATATPEGGSVEGETGMLTNCESSLVLLAGLAQRYFGYTPAPDISLSNFEYGQYSGLFDMTNMGDMGTEGGSTETDTADVGSETTAVPTLETAATPSVFLNSPLVTDEDPSCTQLRFDLEAFFSNEFMTQDWDQRFRNGMGGGMSSDMMEMTPTPSS